MIALSPAEAPIRAPELAESLGLPTRYLEVRLQRLVRSGLLHSQRGPRGGYVLKRARKEVTLLDVVLSAEELDSASFTAAPEAARERLSAQILAPVWARAAEGVTEALLRTTLEDLCLRAYRERRVEGAAARLDYSI